MTRTIARARACCLGAPLLLALAGCFADPGPGDAATGPYDASSEGLSPIGPASSSSGATTTFADTSSTTMVEVETTTGEDTTTGVGTTTSADAPCEGPADCGEGEFCDFPDLLCGGGDAGACQPRPTRCAATTPTYGCNCEVYESACHAQQAGVDARGLIVECL